MILPGQFFDEFAGIDGVEFDGKVEALRTGTCIMFKSVTIILCRWLGGKFRALLRQFPYREE